MSAPSTMSSVSAGAKNASGTGADRFVGLCAIFAGIVGFLYSLAFIGFLYSFPFPSLGVLIPLFLALGGLFATAALSALYNRVREVESTIALLAWVLGIAGALGAAIHGGFDLANALNPPAVNFSIANLPSSIDPRGLLTFGVSGLGLFGFAWLMGRSNQFPRALCYLAYLLAVLLVVLYLGRLIILQPKNPLIALTGAVSGFILNPLWFIWLGATLWRGRKPETSN